MAHDVEMILAVGALLALGVVASVVAVRMRLPALILFLGIGMLVGSDALGWIYFDDVVKKFARIGHVSTLSGRRCRIALAEGARCRLLRRSRIRFSSRDIPNDHQT